MSRKRNVVDAIKIKKQGKQLIMKENDILKFIRRFSACCLLWIFFSIICCIVLGGIISAAIIGSLTATKRITMSTASCMLLVSLRLKIIIVGLYYIKVLFLFYSVFNRAHATKY